MEDHNESSNESSADDDAEELITLNFEETRVLGSLIEIILVRHPLKYLGLPGIALGAGLAGYDAYKNYQNQEGMIYNLFNKDG